MTRKTMSRRTVLKGIGGATVGLPLLEAMLNTSGTALAATGEALPKRYVVMFAGQSLGMDGKSLDHHYLAPQTTGTGYEPTTPLKPIADLLSDVSVVSGLRIPWSFNGGPPPGGINGGTFHVASASPLLSGTRSTQAGATCNGPTSDYQVWQQLGGGLPLLTYRTQASWYLGNGAAYGREHLTYEAGGSPIGAVDSPLLAWKSLFGSFVSDQDALAAAKADFAHRARLRVVDRVKESFKALTSTVSAADRHRLEQHLDQLRELEKRILAAPPEAVGACEPTADPGPDPAIGGDNSGMTAGEIGTNTGYSQEDTRAQLFNDLIHMAFVCDRARVAAHMLTYFQSHMNMYQLTGILADLHEIGHRGDPGFTSTEAVSTTLAWHVKHFGYLVRRLKETPAGDGTLLDHTALVFVNEGGHGASVDDGTPNSSHSTERMCALVAGRAGGLSPGRHVVAEGMHPANVLISAMTAVGMPTDTLGEVSGTISDLFA